MAQSTVNTVHRDLERNRVVETGKENQWERKGGEPVISNVRTEVEEMEASCRRNHTYPGETNTSVPTHTNRQTRFLEDKAERDR